MDLGIGSLKRNGLNLLHSALHPKHGLAWSDGQTIYLSPVNIIQDEVENDKPIKLGEFECVSGLHWSGDVGESFCYLCVVHISTVSLWKVGGVTPQLSFKQVRKIHATPIPQGCLWNTKRDILCIINKEQCTFYFRHLNKKGSYSLPPIESGRISCGCWSLDGRKLIIGIGSIVLIYEWRDIDVTLNDYTITAWKIPSVDGTICAMAPVSDTCLVCSAELPLEALCKSSESLFDIPDLTSDCNDDSGSSSIGNEEDIIHPKSTTKNTGSSYKDSLLNLQTSSKIPHSDFSQLVLFDLRTGGIEPSKTDSVRIPGILCPDLLLADGGRATIIVASNSQSDLHVYRVLDNRLQATNVIHLPVTERPKGICGVPCNVYTRQDGALIMVGKAQKTDPAFLSFNKDSQYSIKLCFKPFSPGVETHINGISPPSLTSASVSKTGDIFKDLNLTTRTYHNLSNGGSINLPKRAPRQDFTHHSYGSLGEIFKTSPPFLSDRIQENQTGNSPMQRVGCSPGPLEERLRGSRGNSPPTGSSINGDHIAKVNLLLPGRFALSNKTKTKSIEVLDENYSSGDHLETETTDFDSQPATFQNDLNIEKLKEERQEISLPVNRIHKCAEAEHHEEYKSERHSLNDDSLCPSPSDSRSNLELSKDECSRKSAGGCGHTKNISDVGFQVVLMETQLEAQGKQIVELQNRMKEISRLLEDIDSRPGHITYKPACSPDVVHITFHCKDQSQKQMKSFILDDGRLHLETVKASFGLRVVELIVDGNPCVVGPNVDGYIPVRFKPKDSINISGYMQTSNIMQPLYGILNGVMDHESLDSQQVSAPIHPPDVTANSQTPIKSITPSSTFC